MSDENIVKKTCRELGITQKELAERLDVPQSTVSGWAKNDIPKMTKFALELLIKNKNLEDKFTILKKAHKILSE
jgi:transcriptional regulator with XRE-family HTH domain